MKKIYVILISTVIILSIIGGIWYFGKPSDTLNADEFFTEIQESGLKCNQNDTWTLFDKVENVYVYYIPELDLINRTANLDVMNEFTAIKFESSEGYLRVEKNQTENFTVGDYATHEENVRYYEEDELSLLLLGDYAPLDTGYMPRHIYNKWVIRAFHEITRINEFPPFNYTTEILNDTTIKVTITEVPDYYPYPLKWNQIECESILYKGIDIGFGVNTTIGEPVKAFKEGNYSNPHNPELLSLFNITVFQDYEKIYDIFYPNGFEGNEFIKAGQYLIINLNTTMETHVPLVLNELDLGSIDFVP